MIFTGHVVPSTDHCSFIQGIFNALYSLINHFWTDSAIYSVCIVCSVYNVLDSAFLIMLIKEDKVGSRVKSRSLHHFGFWIILIKKTKHLKWIIWLWPNNLKLFQSISQSFPISGSFWWRGTDQEWMKIVQLVLPWMSIYVHDQKNCDLWNMDVTQEILELLNFCFKTGPFSSAWLSF